MKEKTVGDEELISPASRVSLEDKPSDRGGMDFKESSWSGGDLGCSLGRTSPRNRLSSQRKEKVCEEAKDKPETCVCLRKRAKKNHS